METEPMQKAVDEWNREQEACAMETDDTSPSELGSFKIPRRLQESSLGDETAQNVEDDDRPVIYEVVSAGSQKRKPKLVDSLGFAYTLKKRTKERQQTVDLQRP